MTLCSLSICVITKQNSIHPGGRNATSIIHYSSVLFLNEDGDIILKLPDIRLRRRFARPAPCKRACRSSGGECGPTPLTRLGSHYRQPSQQKSHPEGWLFCWLGWPDSDRRVRESKSRALPLGDSPLRSRSTFVPRESNCL